MIIEPRARSDSTILPGHVRLSCRVVYEQPGAEPEIVWIDVPDELAPLGEAVGNAWLVCFLPLAFALRERLVLEEGADPVLLKNAHELQRIWAAWRPQFQAIEVVCPKLTSCVGTRPVRKASFFSGGVDSFFTVLTQQIQDVIFLWGFDFKLEKRQPLERLTASLSDAARALGCRFHLAASNIRQTRFGLLPWGEIGHGPAMGAVAHLISTGFSQVLISSSHEHSDNLAWGSHPLTDPLMSSSNFEIVHFGAECGRFEKTGFVSGNPIVLKHLQVCYSGDTGANCGHCEKCYRTMLSLHILGRLGQCSALPGHLFELRKTKRVLMKNESTRSYYRDIARNAATRNRSDVVTMIAECENWNRKVAAMERLRSVSERVPGLNRWLGSAAQNMAREAVE